MPQTDYEIHASFCGCPMCRDWEEYWEARHALDLLAARDQEIRRAKPATDVEWRQFMDAEFPRVGATS